MSMFETISRRDFLWSSLAVAVAGVSDHGAMKPPLALPDLKVTRQDGSRTTLAGIAAGHVTALQLMFTTCTTTCPMEGVTFERVQKLMPHMAKDGIQLVSLSVDPEKDTPKALSEWLLQFHAERSWTGAAPAVKDVKEVRSFFGAGSSALDPHSTQVHILDRSGRVVWRTSELPTPQEIVGVLQRVRV